MRKEILIMIMGLFIIAMTFGTLNKVLAHCDTMEGPVIKEAKVALETEDITPVLKWIPKAHEPEVKAALETALKERINGAEDKEKADKAFFEILVKIHRESEGASFTGIKPVGTPPEPAVVAADEAIEAGTVDYLIKEISGRIAQEIGERFNRVMETKKHMNESVEAGREYVAAYVEFMHYVEGMHKSVLGGSPHHIDE